MTFGELSIWNSWQRSLCILVTFLSSHTSSSFGSKLDFLKHKRQLHWIWVRWVINQENAGFLSGVWHGSQRETRRGGETVASWKTLPVCPSWAGRRTECIHVRVSWVRLCAQVTLAADLSPNLVSVLSQACVVRLLWSSGPASAARRYMCN